MASETKFCDLNQRVSDLLVAQEDIKENIKTCDIRKITDNALETIDDLDSAVSDLEIQTKEQSRLIQEVNKLAVQLFDKVCSLTNTQNTAHDVTQQGRDSTSSPRTDKIEQTTSNFAPSLQNLQNGTKREKEYPLSRKSVDSTSTDQNKYRERIECAEENLRNKIQGVFKKEENVDGTTSEKDTRSNYCIQQPRNPLLTKRLQTGATHDLMSNGTEEHLTDGSCSYETKWQASTENISKCNKTCYKERVCRNDFGFKQKQLNIKHDNRVSFHCKQRRFKGEASATGGDFPSDPQDEPNISLHADEVSNENYKPTAELGLDSQEFGQPKTIMDWLAYAEQLRIDALVRRQTDRVKRGRKGHAYVLVLDCSARMKGQKFDTMITAVRTYINGIRDVSMAVDLQDNIGLAVFGEMSTLISEPTCDYNMLLQQIDKLKPCGDAPLVGGLLLGLAGVLGSGSSTTIGEFVVQGFTVVFTDSLSQYTSTTSALEISSDQNFFDPSRSAARLVEAKGVITQMSGTGMKIFYVPVEGNSQNQIMTMALNHTNGKIVKPHEIYRLIRMTQTLLTATTIAAQLRFLRNGLTRDIVKEKFEQITSANEQDDDCLDFVLELANPIHSSAVCGLYKELQCKSLSLGDRVKRGPDWVYGDQDSSLYGTVVGQNDLSGIWVTWDSGDRNVYIYDEISRNFSIEQIGIYRRVNDESVAVGCRVIRGHDWTFGDEDGGQGCQGTVLNVTEDGSVVVRWDSRKIALYRMGQNGLFEVRLSGESASHLRTLNPDIVNEDHVRRTESDVNDFKIDRYIIPVNQKTGVSVVWEYKDQDGWEKFPQEIQKRLQGFYSRNPNGKYQLEIGNIPYRIDFRRMKKIDPTTKEDIDIRRRSLPDF